MIEWCLTRTCSGSELDSSDTNFIVSSAGLGLVLPPLLWRAASASSSANLNLSSSLRLFLRNYKNYVSGKFGERAKVHMGEKYILGKIWSWDG